MYFHVYFCDVYDDVPSFFHRVDEITTYSTMNFKIVILLITTTVLSITTTVSCNKYTKDQTKCTKDSDGAEHCMIKDEYEDDEDAPMFYEDEDEDSDQKSPSAEDSSTQNGRLNQWDPVRVRI